VIRPRRAGLGCRSTPAVTRSPATRSGSTGRSAARAGSPGSRPSRSRAAPRRGGGRQAPWLPLNEPGGDGQRVASLARHQRRTALPLHPVCLPAADPAADHPRARQTRHRPDRRAAPGPLLRGTAPSRRQMPALLVACQHRPAPLGPRDRYRPNPARRKEIVHTSDCRRGLPLSPSAVRDVHTVLSGVLGLAVRWGYVPHNPAALARPPGRRKAARMLPTPDQARELLATAATNDPDFELFLRLASNWPGPAAGDHLEEVAGSEPSSPASSAAPAPPARATPTSRVCSASATGAW
jgi:hypothetical protein